MRFGITRDDFYRFVGRLTVWGLLIFAICYVVYDIGYQDGNTHGYIRGYVDGELHLKPVDPNIPPSERRELQKDSLMQVPPKHRDLNKQNNSVFTYNEK